MSLIQKAKFAHRRAPFILVSVFGLALTVVCGWHPPVVNAASGATQNGGGSDAAKAEFFTKKVQPVLTEHCYDCHSTATRAAGGLRLDDRKALLTGGKSGPAINLEKPDESLILLRILSADSKKRMPKGEDDPLPVENVANLKRWIADDAFWPVATPATIDSQRAAKNNAPVDAKGCWR